MAEKDNGDAWLLRRDEAIESPKVADTSRPPVSVGEMAQIGRSARRPVTPQVERIDPIAGGAERTGHACVAGAVLGKAVGDLHDPPRRPVRQPAPGEEFDSVVGTEEILLL